MLSRILAVPFIIASAALLYLTVTQDETWAPYLAGAILVLVVIYLMEPQIDWWWYQRFPPDVDKKLKTMLEKHHQFYKGLSIKNKQRFRTRMSMYMKGVDFMAKGPKSLPEDVKGFISSNIVQVTFGKEDYLLRPFERIAVYFEPFPSPRIPQFLHTAELFDEDGVLLFAAQESMAAIIQPTISYNIVLHEYANAFTKVYPHAGFPDAASLDWNDLEKISRFSEQKILQTFGLPDTSIVAVSIHHFFLFPEKFKEILPELYQKYKDIFNMAPVATHDPIVSWASLENKL